MSALQQETQQDVEYLTRFVPKGLELGLRNYWYPLLQSKDLPADKPLKLQALGENLAAWRGRDGAPNVVHDLCPHRASPLSIGRVLDGDIQCPWHGLRFNGEGRCTLIPWEPEDSPLLAKRGIKAYPARDLGGWLWAYIGDPKAFPPPALEDVVPEELFKPDEFIVFPHPVEIWNCNWLQGLDGSDGYHAVMLHSESQPIETKTFKDGKLERSKVPQEDRRMKVVDTPQGLRGVAFERGGEPIHHGHFIQGWKGERWTLPCLFSLPLSPAPGLTPYVARLYQFPIDATRLQNSRWVAMRASNEEEREKCRELYEKVVGPRQRQVMEEDKIIGEALGDLATTRASEQLFTADRDVLAVRRMMNDAWLAQLDGTRLYHTKEAMVFPV
jgi:phenylpropionate dioxygenase-like ring-hydroxylating dioxygenase large terminal subunit